MLEKNQRETLTSFIIVYSSFTICSGRFCTIMHQSIPAAPPPPPPPRLLRGICPPSQSQGWGICKFCAARGPGICQPRGQPQAFDTQAVSYQNITTQGILLENQADWLICQGREKLKRFVKACSRFYRHVFLYIAKLGSYLRESTLFWLLNQVPLDII